MVVTYQKIVNYQNNANLRNIALINDVIEHVSLGLYFKLCY